MFRRTRWAMAAVVSASATSYLMYYKYVHKGEPSPLLANLLSKTLTSPSLQMKFATASLKDIKWSKGTGQIIFYNSRLTRDDQYKTINNNSDNYTRFDLSVERMQAEWSVMRWLMEGKGVVISGEVTGVRGTIDRTHLVPAPAWKMAWQRGEWELDGGVVLRDVLINLRTAQDTPEFPVSIYAAVLPCLRKSWLLYDILSAKSIIGSYDNSLFTYQPPQSPNSLNMRHLRVDSLSVEHVNRGVTEGPLSWIRKGRMAIDCHVQLPSSDFPVLSDPEQKTLFKILKQTRNSFGIDVDDDLFGLIHPQAPAHDQQKCLGNDMLVSVDLKLSAVKAHMPLLADVSLVNQALVRPVVAYLNEHRHHTIPLSFAFKLNRDVDLKGSWTIYESGIAEKLSMGVAEAFVEMVRDRTRVGERVRRVGLWSIYSMLRQLSDL